MNCKTCKYFISTYQDKGICKLYDAYVGDWESCEDWEEEDED